MMSQVLALAASFEVELHNHFSSNAVRVQKAEQRTTILVVPAAAVTILKLIWLDVQNENESKRRNFRLEKEDFVGSNRRVRSSIGESITHNSEKC
jgi:hypothetical protein